MRPAIFLDNLSKTYPGSSRPALDGVSLSIAPGEIYGFLGPNGAGKSTCIRTLMGFIRPTAGAAKILGLDIVRDSVAIKRRVGYLAGDVALYGNMTGRQLMDYLSALQPLKSSGYLRRLIKDFQVEMTRPIKELSKGNRQKLGIIQAFAHQPEVLILDEPTGGLDPLMQEVFYDLVTRASGDGASIFFSSHNLSEVQRVCQRIGFIKNGCLAAEHPVNRRETGAKTARQRFIVSFDGPAPYLQIKKLASVKVSWQNGEDLTIETGDELAPLLRLLGRYRVKRLISRGDNIESEFLSLYQEEL